MASDAADALAKTYAQNKKLLSLRSITNGYSRPDRWSPVDTALAQGGHDRLRESDFAVAIGGKADIAYCTAYVRFEAKRTSRPFKQVG